jgi:hypothetical protein
MALTDDEKRKIEEEEKFRAEARAKAEQASKNKGCSGCLGVVLLFFGLAVVGSLFKTPKTPEQQAQEAKSKEEKSCNSDDIGAFVMAKGFVKKVLKSPSTAEFPWGTTDSTIRNIGNCTYDVRSYVDAQNSFGAKIRNNYHVVVKYEGNDKWTAQKIDLDQ